MTKLCLLCSKNVTTPQKNRRTFGYESFQITEIRVDGDGESEFSKSHIIKYICDVCRYKEGSNWLTNSPPTVEGRRALKDD